MDSKAENFESIRLNKQRTERCYPGGIFCLLNIIRIYKPIRRKVILIFISCVGKHKLSLSAFR